MTAWSAESLKGSESELVGSSSSTLAGGGIKMPKEEVLAGDTQFQSSNSQKLIEMRKRRFISLLDIMEKYQRHHGFFTSPLDLIPSFFSRKRKELFLAEKTSVNKDKTFF